MKSRCTVTIMRLLILLALPLLFHGGGHGADAHKGKRQLRGMTTLRIPSSRSGEASVAVDVFDPCPGRNCSGDILVLPGWNFPRTKWQEQSPLIAEAEKSGFRCVFPEMKTTLYESRYFPETTMKWSATPGGEWIKSVLIPSLQKMGLFRPGGSNFVMGLSTGGRGAVLVCLRNPGLFRGAASLSGDFDQTAMRRDRLMTAVYGPCEKFHQRWAGTDNPMKTVGLWNTPLYLGHGRADTVVPFSQSESFYRALKKQHPRMRLVFNDPKDAGHDFTYWSSEVKPVMEFFLSLL